MNVCDVYLFFQGKVMGNFSVENVSFKANHVRTFLYCFLFLLYFKIIVYLHFFLLKI